MITATLADPLTVGPQDNGLVMRPEEFDAIRDYDDNYRYELINGVLVVNPIPDPAERDPNEELGYLLRGYHEKHPGVIDKTLFEEYVYTKASRRRADRVIWIGLGRVPNPRIDVPTIVVEFVSRTRRDRLRDYEIKRDEYLQLGVQEYWIIDRFRRSMTVYRPKAQEQVIAIDESYRTPLLPGFELPLERLVSVADDWSELE